MHSDYCYHSFYTFFQLPLSTGIFPYNMENCKCHHVSLYDINIDIIFKRDGAEWKGHVQAYV